MKVSDVKLGASLLHVLKQMWEYSTDGLYNFGQFMLCIFGLIWMVIILIMYPIFYPFAKYILLPRAIKRAEKAAEEHINRMFPDKVKTDETNK